MKCPSCAADVADDAAVCPSCDAVLDPSLFDNRPPEEDSPDDPPPARAVKGVRAPGAKRPVGKRPVGAAKKPTGAKPAVKRTPMMPDAPGRKLREAPVPREDWHVKADPNRAAPAKATPSNYMQDPEDFFVELKHFVLDLGLADKLAFIGTIVTLLSCFIPWKDTISEGELLGIQGLGLAVAIVSVLIIAAVVIRVSKAMPGLHSLIPWLVQFGGASFCIVWCLVFIKLSLDTTMARSPIGNSERWVSSPSSGVVIALMMSIITLAGTLMGLKEKPSR